MVVMEILNRQFVSYHRNDCQEEKVLHQKHESYR